MSTAGAGGDTGSGISNVFSQVVKEPDSIAAHVGRLVIVLFLAIYVINPRFGDAIGGGVESFSLVTKVLGGIVGVGIILLVGGMGMFGGKAEADAGEEGKLLSLGMPYITAEFKDWINRSPWAAKHLEFRLATPEGQFPFMFRKLRLEIMALMNFLLRLQVFIGKGKDIINIKKEVEDKVLKVVTTTRAAGRLKSDCAEYYEGNRFAQKRLSKNQLVWEGDTVPDTSWVKFPYYIDFVGEGGQRNAKVIEPVWGIGKKKNIIHEVMNSLKIELENYNLISGDPGQTRYKTDLGSRIAPLLDHLSNDIAVTASGKYYNNAAHYSKIQLMVARFWQIFDQNNFGSGGWFQHYYIFARKQSRPYCVPVTNNYEVLFEKDRTKWLKYKKGIGVKDSGSYGNDDYLYEVDLRGWFLDDINHLRKFPHNEPPDFMEGDKDKVEPGFTPGTLYCRKVDPEDTILIGAFDMICKDMRQDWDFWVKDIIGGLYHPYSKVITGYEECIKNGRFNFEKHYWDFVTPGARPSTDVPAFDIEGLKDPGRFEFRGKKYYHDNDIAGEPQNNFPFASLFGLNVFIREFVDRLTLEPELKEKHFGDYVWYSPEHPMFRRQPIKHGEKK